MNESRKISRILTVIWSGWQQQKTKNFIGIGVHNEYITLKQAAERFFGGSKTRCERVIYSYPELCMVYRENSNMVYAWEVLDALEEYRADKRRELERMLKMG